MPSSPIPADLEEFLRAPNPAVIATVRPDGSPHTAGTWYLWDDGRVLVNMDPSRRRLSYLRRDPRVSVTVLGREWYRQVTLLGRAAAIEDDAGLEGVDRLSGHYIGQPYGQRDRPRVNAWIDVDSWYGWAGGRPWTGGG